MKDLSNDEVIQKEKNGIVYLQFRRLLEEKGIKHMFVLKNEGIQFNRQEQSDEETEKVKKSYEAVCATEQMDGKRVVRSSQTHSDCIKEIDENVLTDCPAIFLPDLYNVDGMITNKKNIVLSTTNADCLLLLIYDPINRAVANIHSGWKGTLQKISKKAVEKMQEEYGSNPKDLLCFMSPCLRKCCFEVHDDVKDLYVEQFAYTNRLNEFIEDIGLVEGRRKYKLDNEGVNKLLLEEAGVNPNNIFSSNICSVCEGDMVHSRRVEGPNYGVGTMLVCLE